MSFSCRINRRAHKVSKNQKITSKKKQNFNFTQKQRSTYWYEHPSVDIFFKSSKLVSSLGDAMRQFEIGELENDFVLISGDVISNVRLQKAFERHQEVRKKDKSVLMTTLFKKASPYHRSRAGGDATIVAIEKNTQQLLHLDNTSNFELFLPKDIFSDDFNEIELRYDLFDCRIDICCPEAIALFHDEFDWQGKLYMIFIIHIKNSHITNIILVSID